MAALLRDREQLRAAFQLVLASGSPRRRELLQTLGLPFEVVTSGFPEDLDKSRYSPAEYVVANAEKKCEAVAATRAKAGVNQNGKRAVVIGADTVVSVDGRILEKPADAAHAREMLGSLAGRTHEVFTGVAIAVEGLEGTRSMVERTEVTFSQLSQSEIDAYIATGEPFDKAGGYGIQAQGGLLVEGIRGDYFNVVGLPLAGLARLLASELAPGAADGAAAKRRRVEGPPCIEKVALIAVRGRKVLFARSRGKDTFYVPGGKREGGETDQDALLREVKEELSVDLAVESIEPYAVFHGPAHGKAEGVTLRTACYTARHIGRPMPASEIEELRWMTSADSAKLTSTGQQIVGHLKAAGVID